MMKITLKSKSSFYKALVVGLIGEGCFAQTEAVSMFKSSLNPEEIRNVHQMLKERMQHDPSPGTKEILEREILKFEKSYITPEDYTLDVSIQGEKGEVQSFNILATTDENKRFTPETPCEAKGTFKGERLYVQPKLDVDKTGELCLKLSIVLGREEFLVVVPYKNDAEVRNKQKAASGPLSAHVILKIKSKGFWG